MEAQSLVNPQAVNRPAGATEAGGKLGLLTGDAPELPRLDCLDQSELGGLDVQFGGSLGP